MRWVFYEVPNGNCGVVYNVKDGEKSKIDICSGKVVAVDGGWKLLVAEPNYKTRIVRMATGAVFKK